MKKTPKDLTNYVTPVSKKLPVRSHTKEAVYCLSCKQQLKKGALKKHSETKKHKKNVEKIVELKIMRNKNVKNDK